MLSYFGLWVGENGLPIEKTPISHPYNYDAFVIWQNKEVATDTVYSDRLLTWDWDKHNDLCLRHFGNEGQWWNRRDPEKVEAFLCDYFGKQVILCRVMEYCNPSSGYPCWRFDYKYVESQTDQSEAL